MHYIWSHENRTPATSGYRKQPSVHNNEHCRGIRQSYPVAHIQTTGHHHRSFSTVYCLSSSISTRRSWVSPTWIHYSGFVLYMTTINQLYYSADVSPPYMYNSIMSHHYQPFSILTSSWDVLFTVPSPWPNKLFCKSYYYGATQTFAYEKSCVIFSNM